MRTPKFNFADVNIILTELDSKDIKVVAENCKTSYQTILKIKQGKYVARTDTRSGLQWTPVPVE